MHYILYYTVAIIRQTETGINIKHEQNPYNDDDETNK